MAFHCLRIIDDATRYSERRVFNHGFAHDLDSLRLRDIVFNATLEHTEAFIYSVEPNGTERCVAACHCGGLPCVVK